MLPVTGLQASQFVDMIPEINSAVSFLLSIIRATYNGQSLTADQLRVLQHALGIAFQHRCAGHWFPERPLRGSAYRCVRIVNSCIDRDLASAVNSAGVSESLLQSVLPSELTLWIDPDEVSYRIGEDGSVGVIYEARAAGDSNANIFRPSSVDSSSHHSTHHNSPSELIGMRVSPDTVNQMYLNTYGRPA